MSARRLSRRSFLTLLALFSVVWLPGCGYNRLQGLDENVKAAWAEVENQYQRRADLIPNLVNVVKGFAKQEKDTLTAVVEARAKATQTTIDASKLSSQEAFQKFQEAQGALSSALGRLMVVVERYPELKSNQNFRDLQAQLEGTENRIAVARRRYTDAVAEYNKAVRYFPTNLTAKFLLGLEVRESFRAADDAKQAPKVEF